MNRFFKLSRIGIALLCAAAIGMSPGFTVGQDDDEPTLTIGSKAPDLDIEHWVSDNDGMFQHTSKLEEGHVYIVEFWATWCGPCISAMPHIAELQEKYKDDKVQVISVSDEDLETVEDFLERKIKGDEDERTYGDLTGTYCLTTDPDKSVKEDYFRAAQRTGIPCAFIVGKSGLVEWIGHPMAMDKPLKQVVEDKWDRDEFVVEYKKEQAARKKATVMRRKMIKSMRDVEELMGDDEPQKASDLLAELIKDEDLESARPMFTSMRLQIMIKSNLEGADTALAEFVEANKNDEQALNEVAWGIYEQHAADGDVDMKILKQAKIAAEYAAKADPESGAILDTLAHLIYVVDGDLDKAIEVQKEAVKHAGPQLNEIKPFLEELELEKKTGKKAEKKKATSDF